jgi:LmbE family N-acetylglucosaminyl deacetylase
MGYGADLLLSPHPDDVVYSAFSVLSDPTRPKLAIVFFNVTGFTRFGLLPVAFVTTARTLEDYLIMTVAGSTVSYLFLPDTLARRESPEAADLEARLHFKDLHPRRIVAPLGVGGHPDHVLVRNVAISLWHKTESAELFLYEDLPYATRSPNLQAEEENIAHSIQLPELQETYRPMNEHEMSRKAFFCGLYFTQSNKREALVRHAERVGKARGSPFAERFYAISEG